MSGLWFPASDAGVQREIVRWSVSALGAGLAHAAVLVSLLIDMPSAAPEPSSPAPMVVEVAPAPVIVVPLPNQVPAPLERAEPKPTRRARTPSVKSPFEPPPEAVVPSEVLVQEKRDERPNDLLEKSPSDDTAETPNSTTAPDETLAAAPEENTSATDSSTAEETWEQQVLATMERNKRYPGSAQRRRQEDTVYVRFSIDRKGNVVESRIDRSQGIAVLDQEVLALLRRSSPLPAPPAEVSGERVEIVVPVEFFIRGQQLNTTVASRRQLNRHRAGPG